MRLGEKFHSGDTLNVPGLVYVTKAIVPGTERTYFLSV